MARVDRFEELDAWKTARELSRLIHAETRREPFSRAWALKNQIERSAISVMANIAEGFDRGSRAEFAQFLSIAKGSCAEVRSHLYAALDAGYVDEESFRKLMLLAQEEARILGGLRAAVAMQRDQQRTVNRRPSP